MIDIIKQGRTGIVMFDDNRLHNALYKHLAYEKQNAHFISNPMWRMVRLYNLKKHAFPWGLIFAVEKIVQQYCEQYKETYQIKGAGHCQTISPRKDDSFLYPFQKDAVMRMINSPQGLIQIPTGGGKTIVALCGLNRMPYEKAIVIVPSTEIKLQWERKIIELNVTNCKVFTYQYLLKHMDLLSGLNIVIFDECHHCSAASIYKIAMKCENAKMFGFSATMKRADGNDMKVQAAIGDLLYCVSIRQLIGEGYLCDAEIRVIEFPKISMQVWDDYNNYYDKQIVQNEERTKEIIKIARKESADGMVLILVDKLEHAKSFGQLDKDIIVVTGTDTKKYRRKIYDGIINGQHKIVVATKIYGEGIDIPPLQTLILAAGGKSCVKIIQNVGRVLRIFKDKDKALIIDCKDNCKYFKNHFIERALIYEENKFQVTHIE